MSAFPHCWSHGPILCWKRRLVLFLSAANLLVGCSDALGLQVACSSNSSTRRVHCQRLQHRWSSSSSPKGLPAVAIPLDDAEHHDPPSPATTVRADVLPAVTTPATSGRSNSTTRSSSSRDGYDDGTTPLLLSLTLDELALVLGGKGRAQACWDCFRLGVDPLWFFSDDSDECGGGAAASSATTTTEEETEPLDPVVLDALLMTTSTSRTSMATPNDDSHTTTTTCSRGWTRSQLQSHITPRRQSQRLGRTALQKYESRLRLPAKRLASSEDDDDDYCSSSAVIRSDSMTSIAKVVQIHRSVDGTTKLLMELARDNLQVECVIIPWRDRQTSTLCVSNQVGCGQACTFCSTGRMGEIRSLTADEILVQVYFASKLCRLLPNDLYPLDAIVYMGMGEAARNVNHVVRSVAALVDPQRFQLAPRRVTISTVGPTPESFAQLGLPAPAVLAWSVHASNDAVRKRLVPTTQYSMVELRNALIQVLLQRPRKLRHIMLEVALIGDVNDRPEDAAHLVDFCQAFYRDVPGIKLVVNLIPWNDISATSGPAAHYKTPTNDHVARFQKILMSDDQNNKILCYIRTTRGDDESAACGQLATKKRSSSGAAPVV